jgi:hypothetical protein
MNNLEETIRRSAVLHGAVNPEQIVRLLRTTGISIDEVDKIVAELKSDRDTYGSLFWTDIPCIK